MLCEFSNISDSLLLSFIAIWVILTIIATLMVFLTSGPTFYFYYWKSNVTFEKWRYKSNPQFPPPEKVRDEIIQMMKGVTCASICPAFSFALAQNGYSKAYCGWNGYTLGYHVFQFFLIMLVNDFWEFFYHRLGHTDFRFWRHHKHHHKFFNPSPFAVIADEWIDQFFRSALLLIFPLVMPINMDLMFFEFGLFFYAYGVYLHWGYELECISTHNPVMNTSFQHYLHHAKSLMNKPYHCGFFFKIWDQLFSCVYPKEKCFCAECARNKGERTKEEFQQVVLQDYSKLFSSSLWMNYFQRVK